MLGLAIVLIIVLVLILWDRLGYADRFRREGYRSCCWKGCTDGCKTREIPNTIAFNPFRYPSQEMGYRRGVVDLQNQVKNTLDEKIKQETDHADMSA